MFLLIESIEMVIRQHFSVPDVHTYIPGTDLRRHILDKVLESEPTLSYWEAIADSIPTKYEQYSIELLKVIANLWITIRGHSFAKE